MKINSNIDEIIGFLQKYKEKGYKSVELIDDSRAFGWHPEKPQQIEFLFNETEPTVLGIDARTALYYKHKK